MGHPADWRGLHPPHGVCRVHDRPVYACLATVATHLRPDGALSGGRVDFVLAFLPGFATQSGAPWITVSPSGTAVSPSGSARSYWPLELHGRRNSSRDRIRLRPSGRPSSL